MTNDHFCRRAFSVARTCLAAVAVLLAGCATVDRQPVGSAPPDRHMQDALAKQTAANQELEGKLAGLRLLLLEKEAKNKELAKQLDEAILEVVRAKAKLRSLESKAEAGSTLAEAEIALKALKTSAVGVEKDSAVLQAQQLLSAGTLELKKENYGGALYLATQAKGIIYQGQEQSSGVDKRAMMQGEVPFALPVPLRMATNGNVRDGAGLDSKVLFTLQEGVPVTGYSYKGLWVRVRTEDRRGGWVYYTLIDGR